MKQKYKTDALGNEIYEKVVGYEKYLLDSKRNQFMARRKNSDGVLTPYFATEPDGHPICPMLKPKMTYLELPIPYPRNAKEDELYPRVSNVEYYIGVEQKCRYALDADSNGYFARNQNKPYYAFETTPQGEVVEFPARDRNDGPIYILNANDILSYPKNKTTDEVIFPRDANGRPTYIRMNGKQYFAVDWRGFPEYVKDANEDDVLPLDQNNVPYYALVEEKQYYPRLRNDDQYYLVHSKRMVYARDHKNEYYAQRERCDELAKDNEIPYYAADRNDLELYPQILESQFYKLIDDVERVAVDKRTNLGFYAKRDRVEFYPKKFVREEENVPPPSSHIKNVTLSDITLHDASRAELRI